MITDLTKWACHWQKLKKRFESNPVPETAGIAIGATQNNENVFWQPPSAEKASHATILAASGSGKTILMANVLQKEIAATESTSNLELRPGYLIVDPKGDLIKALLNCLCFSAPQLLEKVVYLNPFQGGFAFNLTKLAQDGVPIDIRARQLADLVGQISTSSGEQRHLSVGARQVDCLHHLLLAVLDCPDPRANVIWALDSLIEKRGLKRLATATCSRRARQFLDNLFLSDELRASTASRLRSAFAATDQIEAVIAADSCLQFSDILSPGNIVLIDLGSPPGGLLSVQEFYANLIVRLAIDFLLSRPSPYCGHHARIIVDEAQIVAKVLSDTAERILTTGRSRGISLITLSQGTVLLQDASDTLLRVLLTNTPHKYLGRLAVADAELFAKELAPKLGVDEPLKTLRTRFVSQVCNLPDRNFFYLSPGRRLRFVSETIDYQGWQEAGEGMAEELKAVKARQALPLPLTPRTLLRETDPPRETRPRAVSTVRSKWG